MKKKILLIALVLMVIAVSGVFATGVGIQGGLDFIAGTAYGSDLALSLKLDDLPFMLGLGWDFSSGVVIGATADWWMYETNLISIIDLYMGPGIFGGFSTVSGEIWLGPRMAAGLQVFFIEPLELFIELDPYLTLLPSIGFGLQGAAGVRFWF